MSANTEKVEKKSEGGTWEIVKVVIQALLIAFVVRTFLYQPFNIPSGSMIPTLRIGDYLFVSKLSYGYSKYTFSFAPGAGDDPLFKFALPTPSGRFFFADTPERGDVAVFKLPADNTTDYIKRVVGLPGDRVQMIDGVLHINAKPVGMREITLPDDKLPPRAKAAGVKVYIETLPNGVEHMTFDYGPQSMDNTPEFNVPEGHYFMMGDNRDNSLDSRASNVGYVPYENFVGRAEIIFFSKKPDSSFWKIWEWPWSIRWSRFFQGVD
ncbi:MAG: signal peptidase I [Hyphomicrobiales bacterium]